MKKYLVLWMALCLTYGGSIFASEEDKQDKLDSPSTVKMSEQVLPVEFPKSIKKALEKTASYEEKYLEATKKFNKDLSDAKEGLEDMKEIFLLNLIIGGHLERAVSYVERYGNPQNHFRWYEAFRRSPQAGVLGARVFGDIAFMPLTALTTGLPCGLVGSFLCGSKNGGKAFRGGATVGGVLGKGISFLTMTPVGGILGFVAAPFAIPISKLYYKINPDKRLMTSHLLARQLIDTGKLIQKKNKELVEQQSAVQKELLKICNRLDELKEKGSVPKETKKFLEKTRSFIQENFKEENSMTIENSPTPNTETNKIEDEKLN